MKPKWSVRVKWNPRDCWIGVYWQTEVDDYMSVGFFRGVVARETVLNVWVCLLPMLPIHMSRASRRTITPEEAGIAFHKTADGSLSWTER